MNIQMQLPLFPNPLATELMRTGYGGDGVRGHRKVERPVSSRRRMHVTLHSKRAFGEWGLQRHRRAVREALRACARRNDVKVYDFANVGSHLHLLVRARRRESFQVFLRSFAGIVARKVTGARRGRPLGGGPFWSGLAWSRVVSWGRDYWGVRHYIFRNLIEAASGSGIRRAFEQGPEVTAAADRLRQRSVRSPPGPVS